MNTWICPEISGKISSTHEEAGAMLEASPGVVARRWRSHDMATIRIPLGSRKYPGKFVLIDEADAERVKPYKWRLGKWRRSTGELAFYAYAIIPGRPTKYAQMHQFLLDFPSEMVDHRNGDGLDNRRENLRPCDNSRNQANRKRLTTNSSGFRGVTLHKQTGKWQAAIKYQQRSIHLGLFERREDAALAYDAKARELFGEFANLNFPEEAA